MQHDILKNSFPKTRNMNKNVCAYACFSKHGLKLQDQMGDPRKMVHKVVIEKAILKWVSRNGNDIFILQDVKDVLYISLWMLIQALY